jgi:hypothetical protein
MMSGMKMAKMSEVTMTSGVIPMMSGMTQTAQAG